MELQLLGAGPYEAPQGKDFPFHTHSAWELTFYRTGAIQVALGSEIYETVPGTLVLTPPGIPHAEYARTSYTNFYLGIDAPADHPWPRICVDDAEQSLAHLCRSLVSEWNADRSERAIMLSLLLQQLDIFLQRAASAQPCSVSEKLVTDAERYMQEHYHRPLTITEISSTLGISPAALRQHFVRLRGFAPMVQLQRLRTQRAHELLNASDLTLEAIALLCGYDSASHLSRQVKKRIGKSPGALRHSSPKQKVAVPLE